MRKPKDHPPGTPFRVTQERQLRTILDNLAESELEVLLRYLKQNQENLQLVIESAIKERKTFHIS